MRKDIRKRILYCICAIENTVISPERIIYNIYRKSKKKAQIGGAHASDSIVNHTKEAKAVCSQWFAKMSLLLSGF